MLKSIVKNLVYENLECYDARTKYDVDFLIKFKINYVGVFYF